MLWQHGLPHAEHRCDRCPWDTVHAGLLSGDLLRTIILASMLSGYYPHATGVLGYTSPRPQIGDRETWPQHFKNNGYYTARVSKIYHMGVPGGIEYGGDGRDHNDGNGADDEASWTERFNSPGPSGRQP
ncbi:MAG: hypothetical protein R3B91_21225 [Planctomycetaceae bacterium]